MPPSDPLYYRRGGLTPEPTTISGLVLLLLGRPASTGDAVIWKNVRIEVTATAGRGVADAVVHFAAGRKGPPYESPGATAS